MKTLLTSLATCLILLGFAQFLCAEDPAPTDAGLSSEQRSVLKERARARMLQDRQTYTPEQLGEIEQLYQSANKDLKDPAALANLKTLIEKYPKSNRAGCAVMYLGQFSKGDERAKYLELAIRDFSDCYYGDGAQVGPYARYYLAEQYRRAGHDTKARALYEEIRQLYPDAITHKGQPLANYLPK